LYTFYHLVFFSRSLYIIPLTSLSKRCPLVHCSVVNVKDGIKTTLPAYNLFEYYVLPVRNWSATMRMRTTNRSIQHHIPIGYDVAWWVTGAEREEWGRHRSQIFVWPTVVLRFPYSVLYYKSVLQSDEAVWKTTLSDNHTPTLSATAACGQQQSTSA